MTVSAAAPDPEDLTARARIRDAAVLHFGERGFERATIREIAETAGVSSGLVRHHFGSKQGLRDECDAHLVKVLHRLNDEVRADTVRADASHMSAVRSALGHYQRYLARALVEGAATSVFDEMVEITEHWLAEADKSRPDPPDVDLRPRAAVRTAMALAVPLLHQHLSRSTGVDLFSSEGDELLARTLIDIYSHPLLDANAVAATQAASGSEPQASRPQRGAGLRRTEEHPDE